MDKRIDFKYEDIEISIYPELGSVFQLLTGPRTAYEEVELTASQRDDIRLLALAVYNQRLLT